MWAAIIAVFIVLFVAQSECDHARGGRGRKDR
jgi:hypothetical protein